MKHAFTQQSRPSKIQGSLYLTIYIFPFPKGKVRDVFSVVVSIISQKQGEKKVNFIILWFVSVCLLNLFSVLSFAKGIS